MKYDRLTEIIMRRVIHNNSNCIDIGCHKGEILDVMLTLAPQGKHIGFEPIPSFYKDLQEKYAGKATIYPYALSSNEGVSDFQFVKNAPAYSGIKKRDYQINPDIEVIQVQLKKLDNIIAGQTVHFIKIDVEGAEMDVLNGAINTLKQQKPFVIFEFGLGASNFYNSTPKQMYDLLCNQAGLKISLLKSFVEGKNPLTEEEFNRVYQKSTEYYFIAHAQ